MKRHIGIGNIQKLAMVSTLVVVAFWCSACALQSAAPETLRKVGETAPGIRLPDQDGNVVNLDTYLAEGPVVLVFYRGYW